MNQRIILTLIALALGTQTAQAITLSAIYNNLGSDFAVSVSGQSARIQGKPWAPDLEESLVLPQTVQVINKGKQYNIKIERNNQLSACDGVEIKAELTGGSENLVEPKIICISNATSQALGQKVDYYQRILLALEPKPITATDDIPFNFAIASWTSTKYPWFDKNAQGIQTISAPNDEQGNPFVGPLNVMQGYAGWGGGLLPRKNHGLIGHIYNASDTALIFRREIDDQAQTAALSLANFNFDKVVLPKSAVPLASAWIPKNGASVPTLGDNQIFVYAISLGRQPRSGPYSLMTEVAGQETDLVQNDVNEIIANREKSFPDQVTRITGQPNVKDFFSDTTRYKSDFFYGISTNAAGKVIVATYKKGNPQPISTKDVGLALLPGGRSNYFKLITRPSSNPETEGPVSIELTQLKDRKKLFE